MRFGVADPDRSFEHRWSGGVDAHGVGYLLLDRGGGFRLDRGFAAIGYGERHGYRDSGKLRGDRRQSGNVDISVAGQGTTAIPVTQRFTAQIFADTPPSNYDFDAVNLLSTEGITNGCSAAPLDFCPLEEIIRSQMAVFMVRAVLHTDDFPYSTTPISPT